MKRALFFVSLMLLMRVVHAQTQVQVTINLMPPYSAYLQDYAGAGQQIQVIVRNTTMTALDVRLQGRVEGDNGVLIQTLPNFRPTRPLKLAPGETRVLARPDLEGSFDLSQISAEGISKDLLYQGKPLPEGNYQVCIQAYDNRTSQALSSAFPLGCSPPFAVRIIEPPILITPFCDNDVTPTTPQATVFTWTPPAGVLPTQVSYTLRIVELPIDNVDPNVFIDAVTLPQSGIEVKNLTASTFLYGPQYLPLKLGKRYAWRVQAVDKFGKLNLLNDGKSPVCAFRYGPEQTAPDAIDTYLTFVKPGPKRAKLLPSVEVGNNNPFSVSWEIDKKLEASLRKIFNAQPGKSLFDRVASLNYRVRIRTLQHDTPGTVVLDRQVRTPYLVVDNTDLPAAMPTGRAYQAEVELMGVSDSQLKLANLTAQSLIAEPRSFSLVAKNNGSAADSLTITGVLAFRYPGETGTGHLLPNTQVQLMKIYPNNSRVTTAYGQSDALGNYRIQVLKSTLHGMDTTQTFTRCMVDIVNPYIQPLADVDSYYQTSNQNTFQISRQEQGPYAVQGISWLASGYQLSVTAKQSFSNWPGAPDVKMDGQFLVLYRNPSSTMQPYAKYRLPVEGQVDTSIAAGSNPSPASSSTPASNTPKSNTPTGTSLTGTMVQGTTKTTSIVPMPASSGPQMSQTNQSQTNTTLAGQILISQAYDDARKDVEAAGYQFIGIAPLQATGTSYGATFDRLTYSLFPADGYSIYCPNCGQKPQDAESFYIKAPQGKLAATPARVETYTFNIQTDEAPTMTFTGKLTYKFADGGKDGAQVKPLGKTQVHLEVVYRDSNNGTFSTTVPYYQEFTDFHNGFSPTLDTKVTGADGSFSFSVKMTKPMPLGVLPPTQATGSGEFKNPSITYIRAIRVVVDNPYYASPAETFGDNSGEQMKPQGSYDFGAVVAVVRSYNLSVQIKSDTTGLSKVLVQKAGILEELSGVKVSVLRLPQSSIPGPNLLPPVDEGSGVKTTQQFYGQTFTVIATDKSDAQGMVNFPRMVMANGQNDAYFIATESSIDGLNNYNLVSLKRITVSEGWGPVYTATPTDAEKKQSDKAGKTIPNYADVNCTTNWYVRIPTSPGSVSFEIQGPMSQENAKAQANYYQSSGADYYSQQDNCQKAKGYWLGDKLHDTQVNKKVLLNNSYTATSAEFADEYSTFTSDLVQRYLAPGLPTINARIVDQTNPTKGLKDAFVILTYDEDGNGKQAQVRSTDANGWLLEPFQLNPGKNASMVIIAPGYCYYDSVAQKIVPDSKVYIGDVMLGQNSYYDRLLMQPNTIISGSTIDVDNPNANGTKRWLEAYVQADDGFVFKSFQVPFNPMWLFAINAPSTADSLKIFPVNISYFPERRNIKTQLPKPVSGNNGQTFTIDAGEINIYEQDHRIKFWLVDASTDNTGVPTDATPVGGAIVKLFGKSDPGFVFGPSNGFGTVDAKFKNVSVENLFVEISAPGYVTQVVSITNVESKSPVIQRVRLEPARVVKGIVVVKGADGKETPLEGAQVFVPTGSNAPVKYSTVSGKGGAFTLNVSKTFDGTIIPIEATSAQSVPAGQTPGAGQSANPGPTNLGMTNGSVIGQTSLTPKSSNGNAVSDGSFKPTGASSNNMAAIVQNTSLDSYIGANVQQSIPQSRSESLKLTLTKFDKFNINSLWGFPVTVESIDLKTLSVTGTIDLTNTKLGPFALPDANVKIRFKNVVFKENPDLLGEGIPVSETVELETGLIDNLVYHTTPNFQVQDAKYNIRLLSPDGQYGKLKIVRTPGKSTGRLIAQAQVIDNSFNFPSSLLSYEKGQFFLYDPDASGQPGNKPVVTAFDASHNNIKWNQFGIAQSNGQPMRLKLLGFDAVSQLAGSRLNGDEIHLNPIMNCIIKDANPSSLTVSIGDLVLKNNTVDAKTGQTPLTFSLAGNWSVEVRNWTLDYKQGGFYATEGVVKTGKVDVPIQEFNLRNDFFKLDVKPTNTFDLAGVAQLKLGGKAYFGYDAQTGSDMKGHWSVVVVPDGNSAAATLPANSVPGLTQDLTFATLSLLDNGEDVVSFGNGSQSVKYFNLIDVRPTTIETGSDYFAFDAGMSAKIPNAPQDISMRFIYSRPNGSDIKLKTIVPGGYKFETSGYLDFEAGQDVAADGSQSTAMYFADGIMAIRGKAEEPDKLLLSNALLVYTNSYTHITHDRNLDLHDATKLGLLRDNPANITSPTNDTKYYTASGSFKQMSVPLDGARGLSTVYCHQPVSGGQWGLMTFSGLPKGLGSLAEQEQNRLSFTAYGEIKADKQQIKLDGLQTGMGGLSLVYDRLNSRFTGTITINNLPIPPTMTFSGVAQVRIDPKGFYIAASGDLQDVPLIIPVTMKGGIMLGFYDSQDLGDANDVLFANSHRKALPCAFTQSFKGFYVTGEIPVPIIGDFKSQLNVPGIGGYQVGLDAYVDGYLFGNYSNGNWSYGSGLGVGVHAYAFGQILIVEASGEIHINGSEDAAMTVNPGDKSIALTLGMQLSAGFAVSLGIDPPSPLPSYNVNTSADFCLKLGATASYKFGNSPKISPDVSCTFDKCTGGCATNDQ